MTKKQTAIIISLIVLAAISDGYKRELFAKTYFINQVSGKIVVDTTDHGKAWYVFPTEKKRYYLGSPSNAFAVAKGLALTVKKEDIKKIAPITTFNTGLDSDGDTLSDNLEIWLGTDPKNKDTDHDGFNDNVELSNDYNPVGPGKLQYSKDLAKKYLGNFLYNNSYKGLFYLNPIDKKLNYIENPTAFLTLMQKDSLHITSSELKNIEGLVVGPEYMNDELKKNNTVKAPQDNTLTYNGDGYSFNFPADWRLKKYPDNPNIVNITNAERDFLAEDKASVMLQVLNMPSDEKFSNFRLTKNQDLVATENYNEIAGKKSYTRLTNYKTMRETRTAIKLADSKYLLININTKADQDQYDWVFNSLIKSLKFTAK